MPTTLLKPTAEYRPRPDYVATDWRAALSAGVIAGLVFVASQMLLVWLLQGQSPWGPPQMLAAMLLGPATMAQPAGFSIKLLALAMLVHLPLSLFYGGLIGWLVHRMWHGPALLLGLLFGLGLYYLNFHAIAPAAFPWFVEARSWIAAINHALFGVVAAGAYVVLRRRMPADA